MAIENRDDVVLGTMLQAKFRGKTYKCRVRPIADDEELINSKDEGLRFEVTGFQRPKKTLPTLSAAGRYVTKYPVNGWRWWSIASQSKAEDATEPSADAAQVG